MCLRGAVSGEVVVCLQAAVRGEVVVCPAGSDMCCCCCLCRRRREAALDWTGWASLRRSCYGDSRSCLPRPDSSKWRLVHSLPYLHQHTHTHCTNTQHTHAHTHTHTQCTAAVLLSPLPPCRRSRPRLVHSLPYLHQHTHNAPTHTHTHTAPTHTHSTHMHTHTHPMHCSCATQSPPPSPPLPLQTEQAEYQRLIYQQLHSQPDSASLPTQEDLNLATVATATMAVPTAAPVNPHQPELDEDYDD